jgi:hypothetical protein
LPKAGQWIGKSRNGTTLPTAGRINEEISRVKADNKTPKPRRAVLQAAGLAALAPIAIRPAKAQDKLQG